MQTPFEKRVAETYDRALRRGELSFIESTVIKIVEKDIEFELRLSPSLAKKPVGDLDKPEEATPKPKIDPFLPYNQELFVQERGKHVILLNKFCVIPHHLLVVTKEYEKQTEPLNPEDLEVVWYCMMQIKNQLSLAFYNCGEFSGEIFEFSGLPFVHYVALLDPKKLGGSKHGEYLNELYRSLLDVLIEGFRDQSSSSDAVSPSYNFVVTHTWVMIVPRRCEKYEYVSVNSLGFVGMLLLRSNEELEFAKKVGLLKILESVGIPREPSV
ncbi:12342_t:CDS:2 [Acaulospora morrowiae]|uniref:12342_t:CDS:1 n=1 Tax=Acaulospora morrowiae TaxID=94023 RepID=A0A9N8W5W7_9GLOM|nr:12342_t:CDS:2 [Acaulospora morrowiae]